MTEDAEYFKAWVRVTLGMRDEAEFAKRMAEMHRRQDEFWAEQNARLDAVREDLQGGLDA